MDKIPEGSRLEDLPRLAPMEQVWVRSYMETGNASEAYRQSHPNHKMSPGALRVEAYRIKSRPHIVLMLEALAQAGARQAMVTAEAHVERLTQLSHKAEEAGNYGAAIRAEELIGKVSGLYVTKIETTRIEKQSDADLAAEMARETGMTVAQILSFLGQNHGKEGGEPVTH